MDDDRVYGRGRTFGKSIANQVAMEELLAAGKVVLFATNGYMVRMKRFKHLTLRETVHYKGGAQWEPNDT